MKKIISPGTDTYRATCQECSAVFTYQREDVRTNYVRGGEEVSCPHCGHSHKHYGATGAGWGCSNSRWSFGLPNQRWD